MGLPQEQLDLLESLGQYDAPVVVVLFGGSAGCRGGMMRLMLSLMAWYPGLRAVMPLRHLVRG